MLSASFLCTTHPLRVLYPEEEAVLHGQCIPTHVYTPRCVYTCTPRCAHACAHTCTPLHPPRPTLTEHSVLMKKLPCMPGAHMHTQRGAHLCTPKHVYTPFTHPAPHSPMIVLMRKSPCTPGTHIQRCTHTHMCTHGHPSTHPTLCSLKTRC